MNTFVAAVQNKFLLNKFKGDIRDCDKIFERTRNLTQHYIKPTRRRFFHKMGIPSMMWKNQSRIRHENIMQAIKRKDYAYW